MKIYKITTNFYDLDMLDAFLKAIKEDIIKAVGAEEDVICEIESHPTKYIYHPDFSNPLNDDIPTIHNITVRTDIDNLFIRDEGDFIYAQLKKFSGFIDLITEEKDLEDSEWDGTVKHHWD